MEMDTHDMKYIVIRCVCVLSKRPPSTLAFYLDLVSLTSRRIVYFVEDYTQLVVVHSLCGAAASGVGLFSYMQNAKIYSCNF